MTFSLCQRCTGEDVDALAKFDDADDDHGGTDDGLTESYSNDWPTGTRIPQAKTNWLMMDGHAETQTYVWWNQRKADQAVPNNDGRKPFFRGFRP